MKTPKCRKTFTKHIHLNIAKRFCHLFRFFGRGINVEVRQHKKCQLCIINTAVEGQCWCFMCDQQREPRPQRKIASHQPASQHVWTLHQCKSSAVLWVFPRRVSVHTGVPAGGPAKAPDVKTRTHGICFIAQIKC